MLYLKLAILESTSSPPFSSEDFLKKLFPNLWSFLINLIALIVLFIAIFLLAYKPIKKFVEKRKEYVASNLRDAEEAKAKYEGLISDSETIVSNAKKKADEIVKEAQADANAEANRITSEARDEASRRLIAADEEIKQAQEKAKQSIREEIVNVAMDASLKVLGREINDDDNRRLVAEFVEDVQKEE